MKKEWNIPHVCQNMEKFLSSGFNYKLRKVRKILLKENCVGASKYFLILETYITYCKRIRQSAYAMYPTLAVTHADCFPLRSYTDAFGSGIRVTESATTI